MKHIRQTKISKARRTLWLFSLLLALLILWIAGGQTDLRQGLLSSVWQGGMGGDVGRDTIPVVLAEASHTIPYTIWMTSPTHAISQHMAETSGSWKEQNPGHSWSLAVDEDIIRFLRSESVGLRDTVDMLMEKGAPTVMLADIWRVAILYHYGGVYADFDTICKKPIESWLPPSVAAPELVLHANASAEYKSMKMDECSIVIGMEHDAHFCQWAFASTAGHPILARVLELIVERAKDFPKKESGNNFVIYHTGPAVFTAGIIDALGLGDELPEQLGSHSSDAPHAKEVFKRVWTDEVVKERAKTLRACFTSTDFFLKTAVEHRYSSHWPEWAAPGARGYESWWGERDAFLEKVREEEKTDTSEEEGLGWSR